MAALQVPAMHHMHFSQWRLQLLDHAFGQPAPEHLPEKEEERGQGLVLRRCGHVALGRHPRKELRHLERPDLAQMPLN